MPNLKMTGERVVPGDIRSLEEHVQLLRHIFVYEHVKTLLKPDDVVIEVGFGEGYGTRLLSEACGNIVGMDVDKKIVAYANTRYGSAKCSFKIYDGAHLPYPDNYFDAAISFQVIEHIEDDAAFVAEIHRVLKAGGYLYLTTPNRATRLKPGQKPWNRFHKREYYPYELKAVLNCSFQETAVYGISATEEIHHIEAARFRQGFLLSLALKLGLRHLLPKSADPALARLRGKLGGRNNKAEFEGEKDRFTLADFRVEENDVEHSLDLFGICIKS